MQLRIFLQRSEYNFQRDEHCKNKTKTDLPSQYYINFAGEDAEALYIFVYLQLRIGNDMDSGHCVYDALDYNTGTWWNFDDGTITNIQYIQRMYIIMYQRMMNKKGR